MNSEAEERRTHEDEILISALAAGRTDAQASALADCSARTVRRRRSEDPEFRRQVSALRAERVQSLTGQLLSHGERAIEVLAAALEDDDPRIRLSAVRLMLTSSERLHRTTELEGQLDEALARTEAAVR
jgi:hypothetical protein